MVITVRIKAIAALIIATFGYSMLSVVSRWLAEGFAPATQVYVRLCIALVISTIVFWKQINWKMYKHLNLTDWVGLLLMGIVGYAMVVYWVTLGALNAPLINVALLYSTVPFFVGIFGYLFFKKQLSLIKIILVAVSLYGVSVIGSGSFQPQILSFGKGEFYCLLAAMGGAWYVLGRQMLTSKLNDRQITLTVIAIATLASFLLAVVKNEPLPLFNALLNTRVVWGLIIGGTFNIALTYLEVYAFKVLDGVLGSQILLTENITSALLGFLIFRETIGSMQLVGALIIITSVYLMNRYENA